MKRFLTFVAMLLCAIGAHAQSGAYRSPLGGASSSSSSAVGIPNNVVNPVTCTNCTDQFGVADMKEGLQTTATGTLLGSRYNAGDAALIYLVNEGVTTALTVNSITSACGATYSTTPLTTKASATSYWIGVYEAWNVPACQSDKIVITTSAAPTNFAYITSKTFRFADNSANPFDVAANGSGTGATPTTAAFTTTNANDIIDVQAVSNQGSGCGAMSPGSIGALTVTADSTKSPITGNTGLCAILVNEHAVATNTQSSITASTAGGANEYAIIAVALHRLATLPTSSITATFGAQRSFSSTWASSGTTITLGATDFIPANCSSVGTSYCGATLYATTSAGANDGWTTDGTLACPDTQITNINNGVLTLREACTSASASANSDGFTGWVVYGFKDTDALRAAWRQAISSAQTLYLPCGGSLFDGYLFQNLNGSGHNNAIIGCGMGESILIPTPAFNYHPINEIAGSSTAKALGVVYYDQGCQVVATGAGATQNATSGFNGCQLRDWSIWGAVQPGTALAWPANSTGTPLPLVYAVRTTLTHWSCGSWNPGFGNDTRSDVPGLTLAGSVAIDSSVIACGNSSAQLLDSPVADIGSTIHGGVWGWSYGASVVVPSCSFLFHTIDGGALITLSDTADHTVSLANNNLGLYVTGCGLFLSNVIVGGGGHHTGGYIIGNNVNFFSPTIASSVASLNVVGGKITLSNSGLSSFNMSSGAFVDNGANQNNFASATPYTNATSFTITGGTINGSASLDLGVPATGNFALTNATFTSVVGTQRRATLNISASASSPITIAYTFPYKFAVAPSCSAQDVGGTNPVLTFTNSVAPTTSGVTFLSSASATNADTLQVAITCQ